MAKKSTNKKASTVKKTTGKRGRGRPRKTPLPEEKTEKVIPEETPKTPEKATITQETETPTPENTNRPPLDQETLKKKAAEIHQKQAEHSKKEHETFKENINLEEIDEALNNPSAHSNIKGPDQFEEIDISEPLMGPRVQRSYTNHIDPNATNNIPEEHQPTIIKPNEAGAIHFEEPKTNPNTEPQVNPVNSGPEPSPETSSNAPSPDEPKTDFNKDFGDLNPAQKKKAAKQDAQAIASAYQQLFPVPFKAIAKFNIPKHQRLEREGLINLKMVINEEGNTVLDYLHQSNAFVDETIKITDEMRDEVADALVDVLMEQNIAMTPTQRLLTVIARQGVQMTFAAASIKSSNKATMKQFMEMHQMGHTQQTHEPQQTQQPTEDEIKVHHPEQTTQQETPPEETNEVDISSYVNTDTKKSESNDNNVTIEDVTGDADEEE